MTLTNTILLNAALDLAVALALLAVVRVTRKLHDREKPGTLLPSQPLPLHVGLLPPHEVDELSRAA